MGDLSLLGGIRSSSRGSNALAPLDISGVVPGSNIPHPMNPADMQTMVGIN